MISTMEMMEMKYSYMDYLRWIANDADLDQHYIDSHNRWARDYKFVKANGIEKVYEGEEVNKNVKPKNRFPRKETRNYY